MSKHTEASPFAHKKVRIKATATHRQFPSFTGGIVSIEDWWDRVTGRSWQHSATTNPGCIIYGLRTVDNNLPIDDEVVYGKLNGMGVLVHVSEIVGIAQTPTTGVNAVYGKWPIKTTDQEFLDATKDE
jgi:hypothetical protein